MDGDALATQVVFMGLNPGLRAHAPTRRPPSALLAMCGVASSHTPDGVNFSQAKPAPVACTVPASLQRSNQAALGGTPGSRLGQKVVEMSWRGT